MDRIKHWLARVGSDAAALLFVLEHRLWVRMRLLLRSLGQNLAGPRFDAGLKEFMAPAAPLAALAIFAAPALCALPLVLAGLDFIGDGHALLGAMIAFAAQALALGAMALVFEHLEGRLLTIEPFARFHATVLGRAAWAQERSAAVRKELRAVESAIKSRAAGLADEAGAKIAAYPALERSLKIARRQLIRGFWFALAVIFLVESWLWDHVKTWLVALGRKYGVERFEAWLIAFVERLSPQATLAVFAVPVLTVIPLKLAALGLLTHGHVILGISIIFAAKAVTLGATAFLFDHCRQKLMQMAWFAKFYGLVLRARAWADALVAPVRLRAQALARAIHAQALKIFGESQLRITRKISLLRTLTQRRGSA